jgi:hypothetical protein
MLRLISVLTEIYSRGRAVSKPMHKFVNWVNRTWLIGVTLGGWRRTWKRWIDRFFTGRRASRDWPKSGEAETRGDRTLRDHRPNSRTESTTKRTIAPWVLPGRNSLPASFPSHCTRSLLMWSSSTRVYIVQFELRLSFTINRAWMATQTVKLSSILAKKWTRTAAAIFQCGAPLTNYQTLCPQPAAFYLIWTKTFLPDHFFKLFLCCFLITPNTSS